MTLMRFRADTPAFYSAFQFGERRGGLLISHPLYIGSFFGFSGFLEEVVFFSRQMDADRRREVTFVGIGFGIIFSLVLHKRALNPRRFVRAAC
jgi:hypothetical protein